MMEDHSKDEGEPGVVRAQRSEPRSRIGRGRL